MKNSMTMEKAGNKLSPTWLKKRKLDLSNDVERNPGPPTFVIKPNAHINSPNRRKHKQGQEHSSNGVGAFIPKEVLDPKPSREERQKALENKQSVLEDKFNVLVDELGKYKSAALELASKSALIEELRERVVALEELLLQKSGKSELDIKMHLENRKDMKNYDERLLLQEKAVNAIKMDLSELMFVYDDLQDRLYDIDRTWKNNLVFYGIKLDNQGLHENPDCLENKIRLVLKNKLNIGREIVIMRCQRIFNGMDKHGNKPIVVNFQKWSDKEEILRKSKILKNAGISVEEDFSRAAKHRRRELEKLVKEIKAIDPDKKCHFKYDKLIIDDDVYVFNEVEQRVERLPFTVNGQPSYLHDQTIESTYEDVSSTSHGRTRPKGLSKSAKERPWRTKSVESVLGRIPDASTSVGGAAAVMRALTASVSTPSLVAREKARLSAQEKMTPNFELDSLVDQVVSDTSQYDEIEEEGKKDEEDPQCVRKDSSTSSNEVIGESNAKDDDMMSNTSNSSTKRRSIKSSTTQGSFNVLSDEGCDDNDLYLPLNNIVDWNEWNNTGTYNPPARKKSGKGKHKTNSNASKSSVASPKLKPKYLKKLSSQKSKISKKNNGSNGNNPTAESCNLKQ